MGGFCLLIKIKNSICLVIERTDLENYFDCKTNFPKDYSED